MLHKIIFFLLLASQLFSQIILKENYLIDSTVVYLSDIVSTSEKKILFKIDTNKHTKRIKSTDLIKILNKLGFKKIHSNSRYIKFKVKSPINTIIINTFLRQHYMSKYKTMNITNISIASRGYIDELPDKYTIQIRNRSYLSHKGVVNIKDENNKKLFFNYTIDAKIKVLQTKRLIKKGEKLSFSNLTYKTIVFDKFKALPLMNLTKNAIQSKRQIKAAKIITTRDIESLDLVHKNSQVSVSLTNAGIYITFVAKALQNGKLGDIITIQKHDLKRLKARVVGKNKVELR